MLFSSPYKTIQETNKWPKMRDSGAIVVRRNIPLFEAGKNIKWRMYTVIVP
jgi:hypothetical protein